MSAYTEASERFSRAAAAEQAAWHVKAEADARWDEARAEMDEAFRVIQRFTVDPEYDPSRKPVAA